MSAYKERNDEALRYRVFNIMPIRVIRVNGDSFELMERDTVYERLSEELQLSEEKDETDRIEKNTQFAVLSHTWNHDGELTYHDLCRIADPKVPVSFPDLKEWNKLHNFCRIARESGIEFVWADMVCIDKSNLGETDESIRSMFAWYRHSHICISYLSETQTLSDIPRDRWLTRGWTLQELLAPENMKFYSKEWKLLPGDDKKDPNVVLETIARVTSISMEDIRNFHPTAEHIATKMRWIAKRKTKKVEDKAYCMMGIFGVSFHIAYGEGEQRAFCRLFKEILQVTNHPNLFNWGGEAVHREIHPSRMIPSSPDCYFNSCPIAEADHSDYKRRQELDTQEVDPPTLTSTGLRIRLLVVTAKLIQVHRSASVSSAISATFQCLLNTKKYIRVKIYNIPDSEFVVPDDVLDAANKYKFAKRGTTPDNSDLQKFNHTNQFKFGIWNIRSNATAVPHRCMAILLHTRDWNKPKFRKLATSQAIAFESADEFHSETLEHLSSRFRGCARIETMYL